MYVMLKYIVKKVLIGIPIILGVTVILFAIMHSLPGDPIELIIGTTGRVSPERIEQLRKAWGLDQPLYIQYFYWLAHFLQGDFGTSFAFHQPVSKLIVERIPYTLMLMLTSLVLAYILGIPLGMIAALRRGSWIDCFVISFATFFYSMPSFWLGLMLILVFGLYLGWFPISGYTGPSSLVLPCITLTLPEVAVIARLVRSEVLEVLREDYVRAALAKGLPFRIVLYRHVLRNAIIPAVVLFFLYLPWTFGGAVVVETVFAWPGMGRLLYQALLLQDYPVIQAIVFIITVLVVVCNAIGDIVAAILDPRIRLEETSR